MARGDRFAGDLDDAIIVLPEYQVPPLRLVSLDREVLDRAAGALLGMACGDALGVPYEYSPAPEGPAQMAGGGLGDYAPGEWSDDTQMAVCVAEVAASPVPLTSRAGLDAVASAFERWFAGEPADVGVQTQTVLERARDFPGRPSLRLTSAAHSLHVDTGRTAGNGALMRTAPVALTNLQERWHVAIAARAVAELTHADSLAGDSCVLWSEAIRVAVLEGRLELRGGLDLIPDERRRSWACWIRDAERDDAVTTLTANGYTVTALQAAWHAIHTTGTHAVHGSAHVRDALQAAVRIGGDTDTVAAITGALLGAARGAGAIPREWRESVHGWPGMRGGDLEALACSIMTASARAGGDRSVHAPPAGSR
ncbi:ADP-ribosylglycohydrolase family protein [Actinotalea solisilvae]|uniref:ADP-ribosylglycohydrolase family protein n=1 Tax=Actinotalea solisilvae TaxID=2072922 RepID=UPI0018F1BF2A|nr:ADP-ribosylglycohydrolase family protein [Actinotalea solisilvae]